MIASVESDSAQCYPARSLTPHSVSLHGGTYFANTVSPRKRILKRTILTSLAGAQMGLIKEIKNAKKSRDIATLRF